MPRKCCRISALNPSEICGQRDAAGVGGKDGAGRAHLGHAAEQAALDLQVLGHRFDDPVAVAQLRQVVFEVARRDQGRGGGREERARLLLQGVLDAGQRGGVPVGLIGQNDIEQERRDAGVGEMGGNARPHGAGAQHGDAAKRLHRDVPRLEFNANGERARPDRVKFRTGSKRPGGYGPPG